MISQEFRHFVLGYRQLYIYDCFNKNKELFNYSQYIQIYLAPVPVYGTLGMGKALFFRKHQTGTSYINR